MKLLFQPALLLALLISSTIRSRAAAPIQLRAGPLTMVFEPDSAFLRYVQAGPHEVLRGIIAPVRNRFWGTVAPQVTNIQLDDKGDHFSLSFDALCRERDIDFLWHGTIAGNAKGEIEYTFDGTARSSFQRNRIGFCILHGETAAGRPWIIENTRGEKLNGSFPTYISPHQPAKDIRGISHELTAGLWAHVRFEGDVFEMEDQRNWTDASFKTYCTPLAIPYPVRLEPGTKVRQKVSLRLEGKLPVADASESRRDKTAILTLEGEAMPLPRIGLHVSSQVDGLSELDVKRLKLLNLDHLRVDLTPASNDFPRQLRRAAEQSKALGVTLQAGLRLGREPEAELKKLVAEMESVRPSVSTWLIHGTNRPNYLLARKYLKAFDSKSLVGVGNDEINFVQLNRFRPESDMMEAVSYGVTPQIHAFDDASIIETLPIQGDTVRSARRFVGERPLIISPIIFGSTLPAPAPLPGELPSDVDVRQLTPFVAGWTLASFKYLAEAGVHSATYYETVGWKGVMDSSRASARSAKFPAPSGGVFPVYHVLRELGDVAGGRVQRVHSSEPRSVVAFGISRPVSLTANGKPGGTAMPGQGRLLVANLTDRPQSASIRGSLENHYARILETQNTLSTDNDLGALNQPTGGKIVSDKQLVLAPYAIVRIDCVFGKTEK